MGVFIGGRMSTLIQMGAEVSASVLHLSALYLIKVHIKAITHNDIR